MGSKLAKAKKRLAQGNFVVPSPDEIAASGKPCGQGGYAWDALTMANWGVEWPGEKGWRTKLEKRWEAAQWDKSARKYGGSHDAPSAPDRCGVCGGTLFWRFRNSDAAWQCWKCGGPPIEVRKNGRQMDMRGGRT